MPSACFWRLPGFVHQRSSLLTPALRTTCNKTQWAIFLTSDLENTNLTLAVAIGSHHLEYGFPSTHSTNSVSIALFFFSIIHRLASTTTEDAPIISSTLYVILCSMLVFYTFSIVFGRLYTAMHSFTDCVMGVILGAGIWWMQTDWPGIPFTLSPTSFLNQPLALLGIGATDTAGSLIVQIGSGLNLGGWLDNWARKGGWEVPLILIPICMLAVHKHPQPVDDCPCFEDAIAFAGVLLGAYVSEWAIHFSGAAQKAQTVVMPGSGWVLEAGSWIQVERGWEDVVIWWAVATLKMVIGNIPSLMYLFTKLIQSC